MAEQTAHLVREINARLLVIAGHVEPSAMLRKAIPPSCARIAAEIRTGRPTDAASRNTFAAEVAALVAARWQAEHDELLGRFQAELGRDGGLAVQGLRPTTTALREANVATLLITDLGDRTVWTGSQPNLVAVDQAELHAIGASGRRRIRADEALPAAAVTIGATVVVNGHPRSDGVGALLRHT